MKRTALIAALVSIIPLIGAGASAEAQGYGRGYGPGYGHGYGRPPVYRPAPPVVIVPAHPGHFYQRPHWRPRPWWNRPHYWR